MAFSPVAVPPLVQEHASEAAFLWVQRDAGTRSPDYDLADLADLDERLEANLDGLRLAGDTGWQLAFDGLGEEMTLGEAFVAAKIALDRNDMRGIARVLDQVEAAPELWPALPSALGFCPFEKIEKALKAMVSRKVPAPLRAMGIAGFAVHRRDPGPPLGWGLVDGDRLLRLRALEAVGDLGAAHLRDELQRALETDDDEELFWASRAAALLGDWQGTRALQKLTEKGLESLSEQAAMLAAAMLEPADAQSWILQLDARGLRRLALVGAACSGVSELLPWVAGCMAEQEHSRLAGFAFYAITGAAVADELEGEAPEAEATLEDRDDDFDDEDDIADPDEDLEWPAPDAVAAHLREHSYGPGRVLLGRVIDPAWLEDVLRDGQQPLRRLASWHRSRASAGTATFPVDAPVWRQRALLADG